MDRDKSGALLSELIADGKRPRNQIATLSGLTNTYIRNLENGQIENVPRHRLIALAVALNLDLAQIETLLAAFDRAGLREADIPVFIEVAGAARLSEAVLPVRDLSAYELIQLSLEMAPGHQVIVSDRPTIVLQAMGHRTHTDAAVLDRHRIYPALIEAIGSARRENFHRLAAGYRVDHYLCRDCLEDYLAAAVDTDERRWRYRHVAALLRVVETRANFHLHLTDTCANLNFTLKLDGGEGHDKLSYSARAPHGIVRGMRGRLVGFLTENPTLCACFRAEWMQIAESVIDPLAAKVAQVDYLNALLSPMAGDLGEERECPKD